MWAIVRFSGGQVAYHIRNRRKVRLETFVIRIRDPANAEIPIEVTGGGKVTPHVCVGVSAYRESGISEVSCFRHRKCRNPDGRIPDRNRRR
jgi:hypothetical protein